MFSYLLVIGRAERPPDTLRMLRLLKSIPESAKLIQKQRFEQLAPITPLTVPKDAKKAEQKPKRAKAVPSKQKQPKREKQAKVNISKKKPKKINLTQNRNLPGILDQSNVHPAPNIRL